MSGDHGKVDVPLPAEAARVMYEIYRESGYSGKFRVVYFTELTEHTKEREIARAMAGDHYYDGFIRERGKEQAKAIIERFLERLNGVEPTAKPSELERELGDLRA